MLISTTLLGSLLTAVNAGFLQPHLLPRNPSSDTPKCHSFYHTFDVTSNNTQFKVDVSSEAKVIDLFVQLASTQSNFTKKHITGTKKNQGEYKLYFEYCAPVTGPTQRSVLQLIHGINFDHTYWRFDVNCEGKFDSRYNFVNAATAAGYATLSYDRLGVGRSQRPDDGVNVVQIATEKALAEAISENLRSGELLKKSGYTGKTQKFESVVGIGHSYGSAQTQAITASSPKTFDAAILTGFGIFTGGNAATASGLGVRYASAVDPKKWSRYTNSYLATGASANDRFLFFWESVAGYAEKVFDLAVANKQPFGAGELFTLCSAITYAPKFTGPILVLTGSNDFIFCGGSCWQNSTNIPAQVQSLYPAAKSFQTYIPPVTGHAINQHYSAPTTFVEMIKWLKAQKL